MKTVILCGGLGTRLAEETRHIPKPMVTIGGRPILWHILEGYAHHGFHEFVLALGYKADMIKNYFLHRDLLHSDFTVHLSTGDITCDRRANLDWVVSLVDTEQATMTGGRVKRLAPMLAGGGTFMLTYGDGVANVDVTRLLAFHRGHGKLATLTAVRSPARFGHITFEEDRVIGFAEKPRAGEGWINGGFFVFEPAVLAYLDGDHTVLEREPLAQLTADGQLMVYRHHGFWQCMDTLRDRHYLEELWATGRPPWKQWNDTQVSPLYADINEQK